VKRNPNYSGYTNFWSHIFNITLGVRQGSVPSPLLFAVYIDDIAQVTQDIGPIFLPNVGPILALAANIGPIFDRYRTTLDQYCTNIQPICNQYYLLYL